MSDRIFLSLIGLTFGVVTFLAVGMASFTVVATVQGRYMTDAPVEQSSGTYALVDQAVAFR